MLHNSMNTDNNVQYGTYCEPMKQQVQYHANFVTEQNILGVHCMISTG